MAKMTNYDIESEKLRKMGLDPDTMTIRERFEALGGVPDGNPLPMVPSGGPGDGKSVPAPKKRPSESDSATLFDQNANGNPFSAIKPCKVAHSGPEGATNTGSGTDFGPVGLGRAKTASGTARIASGTISQAIGGAQMALCL